MSKWSEAAQRYHAETARWLDVQPTRARCSFCPEWYAEGTASEMREQSFQHRTLHHPETLNYRRKRPMGQLGNFRPPPLQEHEIEEIEEDVKRRAFLNGIKI